ncbi:MAG: LPS export ABC transporter periplasmic protein LptC [Candidatus Omnitrophica bacterium]|nr:LPS export ABC transporter periplasmic protein LptC [Candidatus Omnitrophota bacterium]
MHPRVIHAIALLLIVGVAGCGRPVAPPADDPPAGPAPSDAIQAFNLASYADDGRKRWEVLGTTADMAGATIHLTDVIATTFGEKGHVTVTANEGTFDRERQHVQLQGDVKAVTSDGTTVTAPSMLWDADRQVASTPEWTTVQRGGLTVRGLGATGTPQFKNVRFHEQVRVDVSPSTTITCRGPLEVDYERHRARFWREVRVQDPRGDVWADRMDVRLDPTSQRITQVQCWGHVSIHRPNQVARARRARYETRSGTLVLIGHPSVTYGPERQPMPSPGRMDGRTAP